MLPRTVNTLVGLWLMFAPWALGFSDPAAGSDRTVGPLIVTFAVMAMWEVLRPLRWVNLALALWLLVAPWVWGFPMEARFNDFLCGVLVAAMAAVRGRTTQHFDGGWRFLLRGGP